MQFLGPAEKGIYANGCLPWLFSGRNRSGLNSSGAGHTSEFLWRARVATPTEVPLGAVYPSTKQHKSCQTVRFQANFISQALSEQYFQDNKNLTKQTNWPPELIVSQKNSRLFTSFQFFTFQMAIVITRQSLSCETKGLPTLGVRELIPWCQH